MLSVFGLKQIPQCYMLLSATLWKTRPSMIGAQSVRNLQVHSRNSFPFQTFAGYCIVSLRALAVQSHKASLVLYSPGINRWNTWFIRVLLIRTDVRDKQVSSNWKVAQILLIYRYRGVKFHTSDAVPGGRWREESLGNWVSWLWLRAQTKQMKWTMVTYPHGKFSDSDFLQVSFAGWCNLFPLYSVWRPVSLQYAGH